MVDSEDRYFTEKASSVQSMILYDCDREALSKSIRPSQPCSSIIKWSPWGYLLNETQRPNNLGNGLIE
ncbi:hypothetical protein YC2023_060587 [Brassica napus]